MVVQRFQEHRPWHGGDHGIGNRQHAGGTGMAVDRRHLAEKSPRVEIGQDHLASGFCVDQNPHRSSDDEKDVYAIVLIVDHPFLCRDPTPIATGIQHLDSGARQRAEHRYIDQRLGLGSHEMSRPNAGLIRSYDSNPARSYATAAGGKSGYSSGALARLIQTVRNPNAVAPKASQRFEDTNTTSAGWQANFLVTSV